MNRYIPLKTSAEVAAIRRSCQVAISILQAVASQLRPGISTLDLDACAADRMRSMGAHPAVTEGFPGSICTSVNDVAVHGVPDKTVLQAGDLISIDVAVIFEGWCGDSAWSYCIDPVKPETSRLLDATVAACRAGIEAVRVGNTIGDVGQAVRSAASARNCALIEECVGHGLGRSLHEEPSVPYHGDSGLRIVPGMVLTIEPALCLGSAEVKISADAWPVVTRDGGTAAQCEHTVAVFRNRTELLTDPEYSNRYEKYV